MKPSALRNDPHALVHYTKLLKRSRNMAVTNPTLNGTLDNVKDVANYNKNHNLICRGMLSKEEMKELLTNKLEQIKERNLEIMRQFKV